MSFVSTRCCVSYCLSRGPTSMSDRILCEQTYLTNIWTFRLFFSFFFNKTHFHNCVFVSACSAALKWLGLTYKRTCHRLLCITLDWRKLESKSDSGHRITCLCCQDAVKLNLATKRLRDALCWEHSTREHAKNVSRVKVFGCFFFVCWSIVMNPIICLSLICFCSWLSLVGRTGANPSWHWVKDYWSLNQPYCRCEFVCGGKKGTGTRFSLCEAQMKPIEFL